MTGWIDKPSTSGASDIICSCLITMAYCSWSVQHLNVPARHEHKTILEKLKRACINILLPKLMLSLAISERRLDKQGLRKLKVSASEHPKLIRDWVIEEESWSKPGLGLYRWLRKRSTVDTRSDSLELLRSESGPQMSTAAAEYPSTGMSRTITGNEPELRTITVGLIFGRHDISMPRLSDTSRTVHTPNMDPLLPGRAPCT